jgi:hypothetical protein
MARHLMFLSLQEDMSTFLVHFAYVLMIFTNFVMII